MRYSFQLSIKLLLTGVASFIVASQSVAAEHPGKAIYSQHCLECHGAKGEGVSGEYDEPLIGDRSIESLARRIDRTMPEGEEHLVVGNDAKLVAEYIYDEFYSPMAQARNSKPEFDLARLTAPQIKNSVADLIGRFRPGYDQIPGQERGLKVFITGVKPYPPVPEGERDPRLKEPPNLNGPDAVKINRLDPQVSVNFGAESPSPETMDNFTFRIRWEGSVIAEETGNYEFIVKSHNGFRLWLNHNTKDLIDGWVSSGGELREEKRSVYLLAGRSYPILLEFFKFSEKQASIELRWKPPHGVEEVIPTRNLWPNRVRPTMVLNSNFPADDSSVGYARGTGVSKDWDNATTDAALEVATYVDEHLNELSGSKEGQPERIEKLKSFSRNFLETAYRRPLTQEEVDRQIHRHFEKAKTPELAIKRVVILGIKSPYFLYPELPGVEVSPSHLMATRLALSLWDSLPDHQLRTAVNQGKLKTMGEVSWHANRMIKDLRTKAKLNGFFHHWLELERAETASKDRKLFPEFNNDVLADLRTSLHLFIEKVVWGEKSDYRELLQANYIFMNERLAKFFGKSSQGSEFKPVSFDKRERSGVVTHPYLLTAMAYNAQSSPIHRGVFLTRNIVGMTLNSPPNAVAFDDGHFDPTWTMREKVTQMTKSTACMACHSAINPLGFSLENFDAVGRWREIDNKKKVDAASEFQTEEGKIMKLTGPLDVVNYAVTNPNGHKAFIRHLFNHTLKQQYMAYSVSALDDLRGLFEKNQFNVQKLLADIAILGVTHGVTLEQPKPVVSNPAPKAPAPPAAAPAPKAPAPPAAAPASKAPAPPAAAPAPKVSAPPSAAPAPKASAPPSAAPAPKVSAPPAAAPASKAPTPPAAAPAPKVSAPPAAAPAPKAPAPPTAAPAPKASAPPAAAPAPKASAPPAPSAPVANPVQLPKAAAVFHYSSLHII